jgi:hypothetical protein
MGFRKTVSVCVFKVKRPDLVPGGVKQTDKKTYFMQFYNAYTYLLETIEPMSVSATEKLSPAEGLRPKGSRS